ncbi:hypothetical protein GUJ93_ZPchr0003g18644 [Zizania palustris]|uniref:FHA domain-containing protein n=1 Tax=Zizania palustris TaxID=103762 RepID=A0A8J5VDU6_ZIZPA|nr:hypothetical protein GUJ93_ZPchr0003g18644 [Zizania palustris]
MADTPPVLTLAVKKGRREGETRQFRAGAVFRVGRVGTGNDLAVRDAGASQRHLSIEFLPPPAARWAISDLGSSNGTILNGESLVPTVPSPLSDGDIIKIGESTVLAVSIASGSDPNPGTSRSTRHSAAAAVEKEKAPAVTRRGGRKNAPPLEAEEDVVAVEQEKPPAVTRRSGRKNAAATVAPPEAEKEEPEEAAVVTRRGRPKKAVEPPKSEEHEKVKDEEQDEVAVVTRRGGRRKAAPDAGLPPPPPRARSTRAAARRGKAVDTGLDEGESEMARTGCGRVTKTSARNARIAFLEEDAGGEREGEVAAPGEQIGNQSRATAATDGEDEEDKVEFADGEVEQNAKVSEVEEVPVAWRGRAQRALKRTANAQRAASDKECEEENGGGQVEEDDKNEAVGGGGEEEDEKVEESSRRRSLETMTLREWFERMNEYLPRMINEAADEAIEALQERHRSIDEYISTLEDE